MTLQRYYLLVLRPPPAEVDMWKLRRRCLWGVWAVFIPYTLVFLSAFVLFLRLHGWPETKFEDLDGDLRFRAGTLSLLAFNVPDLASIIVYLLMLKHFRKMANAVHPAPPAGSVAFDKTRDNASVISGGGGNSSGGSVSSAAVAVDAADSEGKADNVMRTLGIHLLVCFLDFALIGFVFIEDRGVRMVVYCHYNIFLVFWVPMIVLKCGFKQMSGLTEYFCLLVC